MHPEHRLGLAGFAGLVLLAVVIVLIAYQGSPA
jgi:hypothetical protein